MTSFKVGDLVKTDTRILNQLEIGLILSFYHSHETQEIVFKVFVFSRQDVYHRRAQDVMPVCAL
jgi:hypothetical protein